ncbi:MULTISPECIES: MFS transporter [Actinomycetes]|uniref:MFS transporter n=1 Tax=Actinomycetes TaxID=1760 RepID=UPI00068C38A9|nr:MULTISPECIES: MFS transporter [Actinomycetes]
MTTQTFSRTARTRRATLAVVCVSTAMLMLDIAVVNTALPTIARDLDAGLSSLQWVVDAYTLALATVVLSAGSWADRRGRRHVFVIGLVLFTVASLACAVAPTIWALDVARAVQGLGGAILFACSLALLADVFPAGKERAGALAVYGATIGGAFALGPLVGGVLTEWFDWRAIFVVNLPIGVAALIATVVWVPESRDPHYRTLDVGGQITASVGLGALVLALLRGNEHGWTDPIAVASFVIAAVALTLFVVVESRVSQPMLPLSMFRSRTFTGAQIAAFAISVSLFSVFLYTTIYLQSVLGMTPIEAGLVYLPATAAMFVVAGATAQIGQRVPAWLMLSGSLLLVGIGLAMTTVADVDSSNLVILPGMVVAMIGAGIFNPVMSGLVLDGSAAEHSGLAAGINDAFRQTGIAVGVAALGALLPAESVFSGASPHEFVTGLDRALWVSAAIAVIGAVVTAAILRVGNDPHPAAATDEPDDLMSVTS